MPRVLAFSLGQRYFGILTLILACAVSISFSAFGPKNYVRGTGDPETMASTFTILNPATQYTPKAFNGGLQDTPTELVSSDFMTINGVRVLGPDNFNQNVTEIDVPVTLQASNTISVRVRGQPGGTLTLLLIGVDNESMVNNDGASQTISGTAVAVKIG